MERHEIGSRAGGTDFLAEGVVFQHRRQRIVGQPGGRLPAAGDVPKPVHQREEVVVGRRGNAGPSAIAIDHHQQPTIALNRSRIGAPMCEMQRKNGPKECLLLLVEGSLERGGGEVVEGGMAAVGVVVAFDEGEEFGPGVVVVDEAAALEHFGLEAADGGFTPGIVIGVGAGGHALAQSVLVEQGAEDFAAILAASVAVEDEAGARAA